MAQPNWLEILSKRLARANNTKQVPDWWQRATVISGFLSSVIIAAVGLIISSSIQNAQLQSSRDTANTQIEIARLKNADDKREQENKLATDLIQHLLSDDPHHRILAIRVLHRSVPSEEYDELITSLAVWDGDPDVRKVAIAQLGKSSAGTVANAVTVASALKSISEDQSRPLQERDLAIKSEESVRRNRLEESNGLFDKPFFKVFDVVFSYTLINGIQKTPLFFGISMANVGRSPAVNLRVHIQYGYAKSISDTIQSIGSDEFAEPVASPLATTSFGARTKRIPWPDDQQLQAIKNKKLFLIALFSYEFQDTRGLPSPVVKTCYVFSPESGNDVSECPKGAFGQ